MHSLLPNTLSLSVGKTLSLLRAGTFLISALVPAAAIAADNPGAHEHGQAQIQMAMESDRIELVFTSPAYNLAGFEHEARTDTEQKLLAEIRQWLETTPLVGTTDGDCRISAVSVRMGGSEDSHHDHGHGHGHGHGHDSHGSKAEHRDFEVTQQLSCESLDVGNTFASPLPQKFPAIEALNIEWVSETGQGSTLLTGATDTFTLGD